LYHTWAKHLWFQWWVLPKTLYKCWKAQREKI